MENLIEVKLCAIYTEEGKPCVKLAKVYNGETNKMVCNQHNYICSQRYEQYKEVCKSLGKCKVGMTTSELRHVLKFIRKCKLQRMDFIGMCCNKKTDIGHATFILKLNSAEKKCNMLLKKL
jgi:hypothetical protein